MNYDDVMDDLRLRAQEANEEMDRLRQSLEQASRCESISSDFRAELMQLALGTYEFQIKLKRAAN